MMMVSGCGRGNGLVPEGMVFIEGGTISGTNPLADGESHNDWYPATYNITVDSFYIGKHEVTWGEWKAVRAQASARGYDIGERGDGSADDHPVHTVDWYDVVKWCNLRSEIEGRTPVYTAGGNIYKTGEHNDVEVNASANGYRLPTEAEWEFAARGGTQSQGYAYSGSNDVNEVAWYDINSGGSSHPVGTKAANELGIHDMSGNVWEWCFDWHPDWVGSLRVLRGGGWGNRALYCRVAIRTSIYPDLAYDYIGFRAVLPPGQQ